MKILFIGDIFGEEAIKALEKHLNKIINKNKIDFVIAQSENASGRKGLIPEDYNRLKKAGIDVITMGNHVWAKKEIKEIINNPDIIRPYNVNDNYPGVGTNVFKVKGQKIRVTSLMGIEFNDLRTPWKQKRANNFFDAFDKIQKDDDSDFHFIDFHGEVTSEKNVFGLYIDGKAGAMVGTHTHVQTNDAKILPKGTAYLTDAGMTGPINSAIGADYESVYTLMRFGTHSKFGVSENPIQLNGAIISINKKNTEIELIKKDLR